MVYYIENNKQTRIGKPDCSKLMVICRFEWLTVIWWLDDLITDSFLLFLFSFLFSDTKKSICWRTVRDTVVLHWIWTFTNCKIFCWTKSDKRRFLVPKVLTDQNAQDSLVFGKLNHKIDLSCLKFEPLMSTNSWTVFPFSDWLSWWNKLSNPFSFFWLDVQF